ncbi:glutamate--tRNA ligase [Candidatus Nanohaloarchaea archaeon]|nr:glutamate--tRNA ligase [Candidatus Nanohaloarchaea archaeon]
MELEEIARKYALKNAVEHGGECNPGAVIGKIFAEEDFENKGEVTEAAQEVCQEVNSRSLEEQESELESFEFEEEEEEEHDPIPDLTNADEYEEIVVRFAPNPNGPPHIGHARGMTINGELRDKYDGKLILRYDDTDPVTKRPLKEAYDMYAEDYEWLGYEPDEVRYSSKNFDTYIEYAEKLIEMGKAYVCKCSQEEGHEYREKGEACPHRDQSEEKNMELWQGMRNGDIDEGEATLKIKTDMQHKNPAIRDFVAFRIIDDAEHPITGDKYRVWPLLDFQGAIEDHVMGTTHIVRGKELRASTKRQKFIYDYLGWDYPHIQYWGNVKISGFEAPVSTSTLTEMMENGELDGWDDPRAPTLRALRKRGFQPEALQNFYIEMGVSEKDIEASTETLESHNRKIVDDGAERRFFVENPVELEISGIPEDIEPHMARHPDQDWGTRSFDLERDDGTVTVLVEENDLEDGFLRLKGLCNIEIQGETAEYREGDHTEALDRDASIVHWVPASAEKARVFMPDGREIEGRIEPSEYENDTVYQFERFGFVRCEEEGEFYFAHE